MVMIDWAWAYWTYERNARVVAEPPSSVATPQVPKSAA
jgi:NADH dehydrogenase